MKPYTLNVSRIYYEYIFKGKGHFNIEPPQDIELYGLQGLTGVRSLEIINKQQKVEEESFSIAQLKTKRYFLAGRHTHSHQELHNSLLSIGLKKLSQIDLLKEGDLVFIGHQVNESLISDLELHRAWMVNEVETIALYEHIQSFIMLQEEHFRQNYNQMLEYYLHYPLLRVSNQNLQKYLDVPPLDLHQDQPPQMLAKLRMIVMGSKTELGPRATSGEQENYKMINDFTLRWSSRHLCWANLILILWRGHKAQDIKPFALSMESLMPLICSAQAFDPHFQLLLLCPQGITQGNKRRKLMEHQETWHNWFGQNLQMLQIKPEDYDALDRGHMPSLELISDLHEYLEQLRYSQPVDDHMLELKPFNFRLILRQNKHFDSLPRFTQILTQLGLAQKTELSSYRIVRPPTWYLAQALSAQCLLDAFSEYGVSLVKIVEHLSVNSKDQNSILRPQDPLLLTAPQAVLICDLINLCFDYDTVYLQRAGLSQVLSELKNTGESARQNDDSSSPLKSLAKLELKVRTQDESKRGVRMLSFAEREMLEINNSPSQKSSFYALKSDLLAWTDAYEWTHDDFYHWNLKLEKEQVQHPFWASINHSAKHQTLGQIRLQKWENKRRNRGFNSLGRTRKNNQDLAYLRLVYNS